jgi:hypothetical protein
MIFKECVPFQKETVWYIVTTFLVHRKHKGKGPFGRHWHKREDNGKMNLKDRM